MRVDIAGWAREANAADHDALAAIFVKADRLGFDGVWLNEFHFDRDNRPYPATAVLAADILARTERLRVGFSVLVLPLHHPLLLAEQVAQLDYQSRGRVDVGVGRGTDPATFAALGIRPEDGPQRFAESLRILRAAWTQPSVSADGPTWRFTDVAVGPAPVQRPHPPLYMAAVTPESIAVAVAADMALLYSLEPPEARQIAILREQLAAGDPTGLIGRASFSRHVVVAPRRDDALAAADALVARVGAWREGLARQRGTLATFVPTVRERFLAEQAVVGTPADCAAQLRAAAAATGARSVRCVFNANGIVSDAEAVAAMELFGREALPLLRD